MENPKTIFLKIKAAFEACCQSLFYLWKREQKNLNKKSAFALVVIFTLIFSVFQTINLQKDKTVPIISQVSQKSSDFSEKNAIPQLLTKPEKPKSDFQIADFNEVLPIDPEKSAIIVPEIPLEKISPQTRSTIQTYVVQQGDTISEIAEKFGLKWSTILWENNLNYWSIIKPGDKLRILPIDGISHKVQKNETVSSIAKKYKSSVEKIIEFNFNNPEEASNLQVGTLLIVPDGSPPPPPKPKYTASKPQFVQENYKNYQTWWNRTKCHRFYYGQCTSWAAYKWATEQGQCVPSWGHAKSWWYRAKRAGYQTGYTAAKGAIIVLTCSSWQCYRYGHVAYVEDFDKNTVTFSELNAVGYRKYSRRTLKRTLNWQNGWKIIGYIYPK